MTPAGKEKCCDNCEDKTYGIPGSIIKRCINVACPCHTPTYHVGGAAEVASALTFEEEKEANFLQVSSVIHCLHCDKDIKREEFVRHIEGGHEEAEVGEKIWNSVYTEVEGVSAQITRVGEEWTLVVSGPRHTSKTDITPLFQRAYEEGRHAKGSSFREGYQRGLEEGKKAHNECCESLTEAANEMFEKGKQAMRGELRIGMLRQWLNEDRITDAKRIVTNEDILHWLFPEDTGSSNKVI